MSKRKRKSKGGHKKEKHIQKQEDKKKQHPPKKHHDSTHSAWAKRAEVEQLKNELLKETIETTKKMKRKKKEPQQTDEISSTSTTVAGTPKQKKKHNIQPPTHKKKKNTKKKKNKKKHRKKDEYGKDTQMEQSEEDKHPLLKLILLIITGAVMVLGLLALVVLKNKHISKFIDPLVEEYVSPLIDKYNIFRAKAITGIKMKEEGFKAKHPVILIPGYITTQLELWEGRKCANSYFRTNIFGGFDMINKVFGNRKCWLSHLKLNRNSTEDIDPEGIRVRNSEGFRSADYFVPGFYVWAIIINDLGNLGYDVNNLYVASYDWRMSFPQLQKRDAYFTRLKSKIEFFYEVHKEKTVLVAHSMGSQLYLYFQQWMIHHYPNGVGDAWLDKHIESFVNIAGPLLGVPKAVSAVLSGEMKDTAMMGTSLRYVLDKFISRDERTDLFRSWGSVREMLPKGPNHLWGEPLIHYGPNKKVFVKEMVSFFKNFTDDHFMKLIHRDHKYGVDSDFDEKPNEERDESYFSNPLMVQLPNTPNLKIFCLYGFGIETELGYHYEDNDESGSWTKLKMDLNSEHHNVSAGLHMGDGDGSVPLVSLGHMCANVWQGAKHNPHGVSVTTREYPHNPVPLIEDLRGGYNTSDHVDILSNADMIRDILYVVTGHADKVHDRVLSSIHTYNLT